MKINKNYLFLIIGLFFSLNLLGQSRCDTVSEEIFFVVEKMPVCNISLEALEAKLNEVLRLQDFQIENGAFFGITFIINCKGEDFNYEILKLDSKEFNEKLIDYWKEYTNWTAGESRGESVDVSLTFGVEVHNNALEILGKKNWKNYKEKDRNK